MGKNSPFCTSIFHPVAARCFLKKFWSGIWWRIHFYLNLPAHCIQSVWFQKFVKDKFMYSSSGGNIEVHMYLWYVSPFIFDVFFILVILTILLSYFLIRILLLLFHIHIVMIICVKILNLIILNNLLSCVTGFIVL